MPINAIIRVVFSAPMALEGVKDGVRLTQAGSRVSAEVTPGDATGVAYDLIPEQELSPGTDYAIEIAAAVEDVNGVPMGAAETAPLRRGESGCCSGCVHLARGRMGARRPPLGIECR